MMSICRRMELCTSLTLHKNQLQMNKGFQHKTQSSEPTWEKIESTLQDTGIDKDFKNRTWLVQERRITIDKWNVVKLYNFCTTM